MNDSTERDFHEACALARLASQLEGLARDASAAAAVVRARALKLDRLG